jgi:hypothetical protein
MDLLMKARQLESRIARTIDAAAQRVSGANGQGALEVIHAVADLVEHQIVPAGRGRRVFPYNAIAVTIAAASPDVRARYEAIADGPSPLAERLRERLRAAGAEVPVLQVTVAYAAEPQPHWRAPDFHVEFARVELPVEQPVDAPAPQRQPISLQTLRGDTIEAAYSLALARIDIGRGVEVRDTGNRLLRTNHVAFSDTGDEVTRSVSRRHAHISADDPTGAYRLHDDGSAHGTSVQRNGATLVVRGGTRGIRLRDGDEIVLGEARLRVGLGTER